MFGICLFCNRTNAQNEMPKILSHIPAVNGKGWNVSQNLGPGLLFTIVFTKVFISNFLFQIQSLDAKMFANSLISVIRKKTNVQS